MTWTELDYSYGGEPQIYNHGGRGQGTGGTVQAAILYRYWGSSLHPLLLINFQGLPELNGGYEGALSVSPFWLWGESGHGIVTD